MQCDFGRLLPSLLQADGDRQTFLHVTECAIAELSAVSAAFAGLAKSPALSVIRCRSGGKHGHTATTEAHACIRKLVGSANESHYFVATQDDELRRALRSDVPGTPLILLSKNVLVLEAPAPAAREAQRVAEERKGSAAKHAGADAVHKSVAAAAGAAAAAIAAESIANAIVHSAARSQLSVSSSSAPSISSPRPSAVAKKPKRRRGPPGPNPLSVKRKHPATEGGSSSARASSAGDGLHPQNAAKKRRRHGGDAAGDSST